MTRFSSQAFTTRIRASALKSPLQVEDSNEEWPLGLDMWSTLQARLTQGSMPAMLPLRHYGILLRTMSYAARNLWRVEEGLLLHVVKNGQSDLGISSTLKVTKTQQDLGSCLYKKSSPASRCSKNPQDKPCCSMY